jgi:hypothetical protein
MGALDSRTGLQIAQLIVPAKAAGVRFLATWSNVTWPAVFTFAPASVPIAGSPLGFNAGRWVFASEGGGEVAIESFTFDGGGPDFGFDRSLLGG